MTLRLREQALWSSIPSDPTTGSSTRSSRRRSGSGRFRPADDLSKLPDFSFVTQKGGSGKSTTAASIAVAAFQQGRRVLMLELDRQGTLSDWADARQAGEGAGVRAVRGDRALDSVYHFMRCGTMHDLRGVDAKRTSRRSPGDPYPGGPCRGAANESLESDDDNPSG
jgi:hypothetical protein